KNFEGAHYIQDAWSPREGLLIESGLRIEWNEVVRDPQIAPRFAVAFAPKWLKETKFSAGWGVYYDAISLELISRAQDQVSLATFYSPTGVPLGPVSSSFLVNDRALRSPYSHTTSFSVERKLPGGFYLRAGVMERIGRRGFTFIPRTNVDDPIGLAEA